VSAGRGRRLHPVIATSTASGGTAPSGCARPPPGRVRAHGLDGIHDQIQEDLLELDAIRQDRWEVRSESEDDRDRLPT